MSARRSDARADLRGAGRVFAALGDETRLKLVHRLTAQGPASIARLSAGSGVTRQAITKHLEALARAGLVRSARCGRERQWEFDPRPLDKARRSLDAIGAQWERSLDRLKAFVEAGET